MSNFIYMLKKIIIVKVNLFQRKMELGLHVLRIKKNEILNVAH